MENHTPKKPETMIQTIAEKLKEQYNREFYVDKHGRIVDPITQTEEFKRIEQEVDKTVDELFPGPYQMGSCHRIWYWKKKILKEKYNIDWLSPKDLNPHIIFD